MPMKQAILPALLGLLAAAPAAAQVERATFDSSPFSLGTLTERDGALNRDLWEGADAAAVSDLLSAVPTRFEDPAKRMMLRQVLLSPGDGPSGADGALAGLKLLKASEAGYVMEAGALAELTPGLQIQPALSRIVAMRDLYRGNIDSACQRGANLREGRQSPFFVRLRALCYINAGERPAAELTISLAREENVLTARDEQMYASLFSGRPTASFPENALEYAAYRKNLGLFAPGDIETLAPPVVAAAVLDQGLSTQARQAALLRASKENLLPPRDLMTAASQLDGTAIAADIQKVANQPEGSPERGAAIGEVLKAAASDDDAFYLRSQIFGTQIASTASDVATVPFAAEFALAALLGGRFEEAERWMQTVAAEQSIGAERAFLNLAKLYSYRRPGPAQRLAGAIGENLPEPPGAVIDIADPAAQAEANIDLAEQVDRGLTASASGSRAALLLAALGTAGVEATGELAVIRDVLGVGLYSRAEADDLARQAAFRREALAFADRIREDVINQQAYIPRQKPAAPSR